MRFIPTCFSLAVASFDLDDASLIQSLTARKSLETTESLGARLTQMLENTKGSSEGCMNVVQGEIAPIQGTFTTAHGQKVDVVVGDRAPSSGKFCIAADSLALLERSFGLSTASDFERALTLKGSTDSTVKGKNGRKRRVAPTGYSLVAARCAPRGTIIGSETESTFSQCKTTCDDAANCAAFEYDFSGGKCRSYEGVDKELALDAGACTAESSTCCYGRPLAAPQGYSQVAARCKPDGKSIGTETSGKTLAECKAICDAEPLCAAFEFEFATGECEMVTGIDKELALQDEDGPCSGESCCYGRPLAAPQGYSQVAARCKPDGKSIGTETSGKTLTECKAICDAEPLCAAFEFEFATGECEMVTGIDKELALQDEDGPCSGESCCYGRPLAAPQGYSQVAARCKPDGKSIGTETSGKTLTECKAICDAEPLCAAFEFEFATGECEMVSGIDKELALQDEDGPCSGESCCYGRPLAAPDGFCQVAARCKPDGKSIGTETSGKSLAECKQICDAESSCAAFEFEFATGECEMVSEVDSQLSLADEDGPCSGESCCYSNIC